MVSCAKPGVTKNTTLLGLTTLVQNTSEIALRSPRKIDLIYLNIDLWVVGGRGPFLHELNKSRW